jgi:hypothetical protein
MGCSAPVLEFLSLIRCSAPSGNTEVLRKYVGARIRPIRILAAALPGIAYAGRPLSLPVNANRKAGNGNKALSINVGSIKGVWQ